MLWVIYRHLLRSVVFTAAWSVTILAFIFATVHVFKDLLPYLLDGRIPLEMFLHLSGLLFPYVLTYTLPVGMLLGVLLVLGRLSADNEILAMRSSGLSLMQIIWPVLALSAVAVGFGLFTNFSLMPKARVAYHDQRDSAIRNSALNIIKPRTFVRDIQRVVFYCNERVGDLLKDVWIWRLDNKGRVTEFGHAAIARLMVDNDKAELTLALKDVRMETRDSKDPEDFSRGLRIPRSSEANYTFPIESLLGKSTRRQNLDWMTLDELKAEREKRAAAGAPPTEQIKPSLALHSKINSALAIFTFTLVGIPLGIRVQRKETSANFGVALLLVMAYYFSTSAVGVLEAQPALRPDLLLWIPNVLFVILGLRLIQLVQRV